MTALPKPRRGEVWRVRLDPIQGHEQAGERPCLVISHDKLNQGQSELVIVVPITRTMRENPFHVDIEPPEGGLKVRGQILCEHVRSLSAERLVSRVGEVSMKILSDVEYRVRVLLDI